MVDTDDCSHLIRQCSASLAASVAKITDLANFWRDFYRWAKELALTKPNLIPTLQPEIKVYNSNQVNLLMFTSLPYFT